MSQPALSTLATSSQQAGQRYNESDVHDLSTSSRHLPQVEKDADDPNSPPTSSHARHNREGSTTLTTLSRLFAVQAATSPSASRTPSYQETRPISTYNRSLQSADSANLPSHLYSRGLLEGRHSDITVHAFGQEYKLHRLILDRAPFFRSALSEPWLESSARDTTVHPEDIDPSITQASFELALKRLYGCNEPAEESRDAVGLFATGCWLEMQDLIESSVESMLRQMTAGTLAPLIRLVTSNYYGRAGDKILASAKAMLCRDGWCMPLRYWDGIPGDIIREIVGGDGFFIDGEWDRWALAKRILDRRLKSKALDAGLVEPGTTRKVLKAPDPASLMAVRFDGVYRKNGMGSGRGVPDHLHRWVTLYTLPEIEPLLVLLDEGIHYVHLDFEQLQFIKDTRDILGLPVLPQKVVGDALWQQMELRQKVLNARDGEMDLGISVTCTDDTDSEATRDTTMNITTPLPPSPPSETSNPFSKGKQPAASTSTSTVRAEPTTKSCGEEDIASDSWDANGKPRKFWIPTSDCNIVMGGNADPVIATSNNTTLQRHASRLSATLGPEDVQWMSDFGAVTAQPRNARTTAGANGGSGGAQGENGAAAGAGNPNDVRYTHFPPFRFAASFPNPRLLKERKRVYSRTVFYAGSLWNIYIQKVASTRSKQLGVYLHRAKERDAEEVIANTAGLAQGSVDERIGVLEREMILRSERRDRRDARRRTTVGSDGADTDGADSLGSAGDEPALVEDGRPSLMHDLLVGSRPVQRGRQADAQVLSNRTSASTTTNDTMFTPATDPSVSSSDTDDADLESPTVPSASASHYSYPTQKQKRPHVPTLPPYVDARPTIKTYFKIYSPSRGGRMLSVYESAPDSFNFSQSWGWKSSTLMLDDGLDGDDTDGAEALVEGEDKARKEKDGRLRFMVVIGNI
ncbi:uncharacterized protein LTR77_007669 [Saxophila tyrrhenica]|uniref:BTB domain-containing protein n=1 Tax=Saxophila tyrrhenica TaxID=1690608 RepID=A0AAV9P6I7_9PEZI|nr:hypothetical protein LTR77_007669 [Saxophila tyrrhenica]